MGLEKEKPGAVKKLNGSIRSIFIYADGLDMWLRTLGFIGAVADAFSTLLILLVTSKIMNNLGDASAFTRDMFINNINEKSVALLYLAYGSWLACFREGFCCSRAGKRQATRMRARYLKSVLRQDVGYIDLHVDF
ncbi:hypothetical protein REPUB_Repub09cG0043200 [Reevesia pubescens]